MNKYLEKIAAALHPDEDPKGGYSAKRIVGRAMTENVVGAAMGGSLGSAFRNPKISGALGLVGGVMGGVHGVSESLKNQTAEMRAKYKK